MGARHRSLRQIQPAHTRLKRGKKRKLGCESGKENGERRRRRRRREEQDKEEEEKKKKKREEEEEEGAEHPMHAPTGAQIKK